MKKYIILALVTLMTSTMAMAQGRRALKINEVMVANDSNVVDDYGQHSAWIELFNSAYASMDISNVFIGTNKDEINVKNKAGYPVPIGDVRTEIPARQHLVFWADGMPTRGTLHMNFTFKPGQENWIGIYDGGVLVDSVTIPASLKAGHTYARVEDGGKEWELRLNSENSYITPGSSNKINDTNEKIGKFQNKDPHGFGMAIMAMGIVFLALIVLSLCFYGISKIGASVNAANKLRSKGINPIEATKEELKEFDSGEEIAAVVMALHDHLNAHDNEQTVLTINKAKRAYSPWSSKIYSIRELPNRR